MQNARKKFKLGTDIPYNREARLISNSRINPVIKFNSRSLKWISFNSRHKFSVLINRQLQLSTFPPKVHSGPLNLLSLFSSRLVLSLGMRQLYSRLIYTAKLRIAISCSYFLYYFPAIVVQFFWSFVGFLSCREKLKHDMLNSIFWKIAFDPKNQD